MNGVVTVPSPRRADGVVAQQISVGSPTEICISLLAPADWPYLSPGAQAVEALAASDCRWPIGEVGEPGFRFCGGRRERGSYCAAHRALSRGGSAR